MNYKKAYIYEITNNINKKTYVGQHKSKTEKDNYFGSGTVLNQAFDKYGKENFSKIILEEIPLNENLQEELNKKEIFWINKRKSEGKAEYNISGGGQCCSNPFLYKTEEEKKMIYEKMGKTRTGIPSKVAGKRIKHTKKEILPKEEISKKFKKINREKLGKEIIIMETEEVFNSAGDFMDKYGVQSDTSWISKAARSNGLKKAIGLDFSPVEMYVSSENQTGKDFGYIAQKQAHSKKLRKLQRRLARKQFLKDPNSPKKLPSKNREKSRIKLARLEEHIANSRKDWIEKESLRLVRSYEKIVIEDLNLKGISAFLRNARNMNDTSWATFVSRLEAKGKDYSCEVVKADRWFPSSQLCSVCGFQFKSLTLKMREWTCPKCGTNHIRDLNAAINLKNYVPLEEREFTPVESSKVANLAEFALQATELVEAGSTLQVTKCRNLPNI